MWHSPPLYAASAIPCNKEDAHSAGLTGQRGPGSFCACVAPSPRSPRGRQCLTSSPAETATGEQEPAPRQGRAQEGCRGGWAAPAPECTTTQSGTAGGAVAEQVSFVPTQQDPPKPGAPSCPPERGLRPTARTTEWVGTTTEGS